MTTTQTQPKENQWQSSATLADIAQRLKGASHVVVLTHTKPDGDAVGSVLSVVRALQAAGTHAVGVFTGAWPDRFTGLIQDTPVVFVPEHDDLTQSAHAFEAEPIASADAICIVDTGAWSQLPEAKAWLTSKANITCNIDHHAHGDADLAAHRFINSQAASACELCAALAAEILGLDSLAKLPTTISTPAYLGMATDTGWFKHPSVKPATLRTAADLLECGTDANALRRLVEQSDPPERLELMKRALASLNLHLGKRVSVMKLSRADFADAGASPDDSGGLIDLPQSVERVRVSVLLTDKGNGITKVSMRSKAGTPHIDVNEIAQTLGGGGHIHAAGAKAQGSFEDVEQRIVAEVEKQLTAAQ